MAATADSSSSSSSSRAATSVVSMTHSSPSLPSPWSQVVRNNTTANNNNNNNDSHHEPPLPPPQQVQSPSSSPSVSQPLSAALEQQRSPASTESPPPHPPVENNVPAAESSSGNNGNAEAAAAAARRRRPVWNVPVQAVSETGEGSHLIGDEVAWPALSESTRGGGASRQPPSSLDAVSSPRSVAEGLNSSSRGSLIPNSPRRPTTNANSSHNTTLNHSGPSRHRSNRRGGAGSGNNGNNNGNNNSGSLAPHTGFPRSIPAPPPLPPPFPTYPVPPNAYFVPTPPPPEFPIREPPFRGNNWDNRPAGGFMSQSHMMNDHRSSSRRGRGNGSSHNSHGNRRDQDRGNYTSARDAHVQPQRGASRGFVRPLPSPTTPPVFLVPPHVRGFGSPMGFSDMTSQFYVPSVHMEPFRGVPFIAHAPPPPVFIPQEPPLSVRIVNQIDYYFSDENLVKDDYLKSKMDDEGWVPISLIARFPRVMHLTTDTNLVLESLRASTIVEVQGDKVRRRNEWRRWICSPVALSAEAGLPSFGGSNDDQLVDSLQRMTMDEGTGNSNSMTSNVHLQSENVNGRDMEFAGQRNFPNSNRVDVASSSQT